MKIQQTGGTAAFWTEFVIMTMINTVWWNWICLYEPHQATWGKKTDSQNALHHTRAPFRKKKQQHTNEIAYNFEIGPNGHFHMHLACNLKFAAYYGGNNCVSLNFFGGRKFFLSLFRKCKMNLLCIVEFHMFYVINSDKLWDEAAFLDGIMAKTTDPIPFALFVALCIAASMFNSTWTCVLCCVCVCEARN